MLKFRKYIFLNISKALYKIKFLQKSHLSKAFDMKCSIKKNSPMYIHTIYIM